MSHRNWSSASWYRVAEFRPRLRAHAAFYRHVYRGQVWFVLQDRASGRFHRFTPDAYRLIAMMDGTRRMEDIWDLANRLLEIDAVTQDELVRLVGQLYSADVLSGDIPPDIVELSERGRKAARQKIVRSILNPLALRLPLINPDDFLSATLPLVRPFLSVFGALIFVAVVSYGLVLAALNWGPLTENAVDRVLARDNLLLLLLAYPAVKGLHELGHAYTIKRWGGSVHEIGVMFLVFMPVPYVDASDSLAFPSKWRRALVAAAGILVEVFLAAIAMIVWAGADEGLVRAFAFNVMLIGGVSTLFFNGNPLLRFDGYYVLCDLVEIPNLGQRANTYVGYLVQRYAFGLKWVENPVSAPGEATWFLFYAVAAYIYRLFITFAIVTLVATRFFIIGIVLAAWALFLMLILPILKGAWFVLTSPGLRRSRGRAFAVTGGTLGLLLGVLLAVPVPDFTLAEGVVAPGPEASAHAGSDGIVTEVYVHQGQHVVAGTPILRIEEPLIVAQRGVITGRIVELERRLAAEESSDRTAIRILREELGAAKADLALTEERIASQVLRSGREGEVIFPRGGDMIGQFVARGDELVVVAPFRDPMIRVVVPEARADLVRGDMRAVELRFAVAPDRVYPASVVRAGPSLTRTLPSLALAREGGGSATLDPARPRGDRATLESMVQLDLRVPDGVAVGTYGDRVYVRFRHSDGPLAGRIYRAAARIFLKYFAVGGATA